MMSVLDTPRHCVVSGVRLPYALSEGPATPVVLLHGLTDSQRSFDPVFARMAGRRTLFAPTYRGHGDADRPTAGYRPTDLAADVLAMLDEVGISRAVVVGHSLGAAVALRLAVAAPGRVAGLLLAAGFGAPARNAGVIELQEAVQPLGDPIPVAFAEEFQRSTVTREVPEPFMAMVIGESLKVPAHVWRAATIGFAESDPLDGLAALQMPVRLVWGERDAYVTRADQDLLLGALPAATLSVYEDTGHAVHWEQPDRFVDELTTFSHGLS